MNLSLSDEQRMIRESVFDYFNASYDFDKHLARLGQGQAPDATRWRMMAELGWLGLSVSDDANGMGMGPQETMLLMEGVGASLNVEPLMATSVLAAPILAATQQSGDAARKALEAVLAGNASLALAWTESAEGFRPLDVQATAETADGGFALSGQKVLVENGADATWIIVPARSAQGLALLLVDGNAAGLQRTAVSMADGTWCADLRFGRVHVPAGHCLAQGTHAEALLLRAIYRGLAASCAQALGAMDRALAICRSYLHERSQFGQPLARFQVLQHRYVDMLIATERARSMTLLAAIRADEAGAGDADAQRDLSLAKLTVGRSARFVGGQAIQVHGGMGMAYEYPIGHYYRKLLCCDASFGSQDDHLSLLSATAP